MLLTSPPLPSKVCLQHIGRCDLSAAPHAHLHPPPPICTGIWGSLASAAGTALWTNHLYDSSARGVESGFPFLVTAGCHVVCLLIFVGGWFQFVRGKPQPSARADDAEKDGGGGSGTL